ncbi:c-type cytochrome [Flavobacterium sp. XGLA_31]|uniref:c-type cytochrome n=1 Tax=Flavobacterium sp. XGLA_31 TaxID=3447666 RepID=UPI003F3C5EA8
MKYKVVALALLSVIIYSCASKSSVPTTAATKTESASTVMTAELAEGKMLYENNCAKCHKLYDPKGFSAQEWKPIMDKMQKKAHLDDAQGLKIYNYVTMK